MTAPVYSEAEYATILHNYLQTLSSSSRSTIHIVVEELKKKGSTHKTLVQTLSIKPARFVKPPWDGAEAAVAKWEVEKSAFDEKKAKRDEFQEPPDGKEKLTLKGAQAERGFDAYHYGNSVEPAAEVVSNPQQSHSMKKSVADKRKEDEKSPVDASAKRHGVMTAPLISSTTSSPSRRKDSIAESSDMELDEPAHDAKRVKTTVDTKARHQNSQPSQEPKPSPAQLASTLVSARSEYKDALQILEGFKANVERLESELSKAKAEIARQARVVQNLNHKYEVAKRAVDFAGGKKAPAASLPAGGDSPAESALASGKVSVAHVLSLSIQKAEKDLLLAEQSKKRKDAAVDVAGDAKRAKTDDAVTAAASESFSTSSSSFQLTAVSSPSLVHPPNAAASTVASAPINSTSISSPSSVPPPLAASRTASINVPPSNLTPSKASSSGPPPGLSLGKPAASITTVGAKSGKSAALINGTPVVVNSGTAALPTAPVRAAPASGAISNVAISSGAAVSAAPVGLSQSKAAHLSGGSAPISSPLSVGAPARTVSAVPNIGSINPVAGSVVPKAAVPVLSSHMSLAQSRPAAAPSAIPVTPSTTPPLQPPHIMSTAQIKASSIPQKTTPSIVVESSSSQGQVSHAAPKPPHGDTTKSPIIVTTTQAATTALPLTQHSTIKPVEEGLSTTTTSASPITIPLGFLSLKKKVAAQKTPGPANDAPPESATVGQVETSAVSASAGVPTNYPKAALNVISSTPVADKLGDDIPKPAFPIKPQVSPVNLPPKPVVAGGARLNDVIGPPNPAAPEVPMLKSVVNQPASSSTQNTTDPPKPVVVTGKPDKGSSTVTRPSITTTSYDAVDMELENGELVEKAGASQIFEPPRASIAESIKLINKLRESVKREPRRPVASSKGITKKFPTTKASPKPVQVKLSDGAKPASSVPLEEKSGEQALVMIAKPDLTVGALADVSNSGALAVQDKEKGGLIADDILAKARILASLSSASSNTPIMQSPVPTQLPLVQQSADLSGNNANLTGVIVAHMNMIQQQMQQQLALQSQQMLSTVLSMVAGSASGGMNGSQQQDMRQYISQLQQSGFQGQQGYAPSPPSQLQQQQLQNGPLQGPFNPGQSGAPGYSWW